MTFQKDFMNYILKSLPYLKLEDLNVKLINKGIEDKFISRNIFFNEIKKITPQVVDDLFNNLPLFEKLINKYIKWEQNLFKSKNKRPKRFNWSILLLYAKTESKALKLIEKIRGWGETYNLNDIWILDSAIQVLTLWFEVEKHRKEKTFIYMGNEYYIDNMFAYEGKLDYIKTFNPITEYDKPINKNLQAALNVLGTKKQPDPITLLSIPAYNPQLQTKEEHKKVVLNRLEEYQERIIKKAATEGFSEPPEKRNIDHFKWLVSYQIEGLSLRDVGKKYEEDKVYYNVESKIEKGIKTVAKMINLTIRKGEKGGRPSKN